MMRFARLISTKTFATAVVVASVALSMAATSARAQVGYTPSKSPYEDLKPSQDLTVFFGQFGSSPGIAGVLAKSSLFGGARYDVPVGGPASLYGRYSFVSSERAYLLPSNSRANRFLGTVGTTTNIADLGLAIALTGRKTYHRLVPSLQGGFGVAIDPAKADTGLYRFGTKFTITYGLDLHYILRNGWGARANATSFFWQNSYPDNYAITGADMTSVLKNTTDRTAWKNNWTFTLGLSIPIVR